MTNQLNSYQEELAKFAQEDAAAAPVGGEFLNVKNAQLHYKGAPVQGNALDVVVLGFTKMNTYYPGAYNPNAIVPPDCYAFGADEKLMKPHAKSADPQHTDCATCPLNQFGSAGKGKACKNQVRLAFVLAEELENLQDADPTFFKLSVTNVKAFNAVVQKLATVFKLPIFGAVCRITVTPDPKNQYALHWEVVEKIEDGPTIGALIEKRKSLILDFPFADAPAAPANPAPAVRAGASTNRFSGTGRKKL